jgi:hypothetical protein
VVINGPALRIVEAGKEAVGHRDQSGVAQKSVAAEADYSPFKRTEPIATNPTARRRPRKNLHSETSTPREFMYSKTDSPT